MNGAPRRGALWVPVVPAALLVLHVTLMYRAALHHTGGVVSYPVDDAFIHLALAKHIALDGVYGVSAREFTAASSSIGWPLLLALAVKLLGAHAWLPLALNLAIGVALLFAGDAVARRVLPEASPLLRLLALSAVVFFTPLPTLVVLGMEHTLHATATIALVGVASAWLAKDGAGQAWHVALLAAGTTLWRYEGAFPVALVALLAWRRGRLREGAAIALAGAAPILLFGAYSKAKGGLFLPTPVVLKGRHLDLGHLGDVLGVDLMDRLGVEGAVLAVIVASALTGFLVARRDGPTARLPIALGITTVMILMHLELASVGWFFRYESYLLATGLLFSVLALGALLPAPRALLARLRAEPAVGTAGALVALLVAMPLRVRAARADADTPTACRNIFEQQMQTGRFLAKYFSGARVAVNDIGAVAWLGDEPMLDLMGLASLEMARAKGMSIDRAPSPADIVRLSAGVKVAIVYDEWFADGLPTRWLRVGRWRIENSRSPAFPQVSIYATDPASYPEVITALRSFAPEMPERVHRSGRFMDLPAATGRVRAFDRLSLKGLGAPLDGAAAVDEDGLVALPGVAKVEVGGRTLEEARAAIVDELLRAGRPASRLAIARAEPGPARVLVAGDVPRVADLAAGSLAVTVAVAGAPDGARAWVWRERVSGFVRLAREELDHDALEDGDIVVVVAPGG